MTPWCSDGDIRLVGGGTPNEGRVEICYQNNWGTVCDNSWDVREAMVVCRQLNFTSTGASPYSSSLYGSGSGGIYLDRVSCSGNEQALINCSHRGIGVHSCTHSEDAGVMCLVGNLDNCTDGELRLISGQSSSEGTVQICAFGYWGTICRNSWDSREADVVCNQLGYPALGSIPYASSSFAYTLGPIWLNNFQCQGNESSLFSGCSHGSISVITSWCDHSDDVGVHCVASSSFASCTEGQLRLVGGSSENEGRVEICYKNRWGTVCHHGWSAQDAEVVCRQLGLQTLGAVHFLYYGSNYFGLGTGQIFLDDVACSGDELMLMNCRHSGVGVHNCRHSQDAGVVCQGAYSDNCTEGEVRLVSTSDSSRMEGVVQVCAYGYWGTVCDRYRSWDSQSAQVVCNQLGYTNFSAIPLYSWRISGFAALKFPIWLDRVLCTGNESSLIDCSHNGIGEISTACNHYYDVGVRCLEPVTSATPCTNGTVRLVGGSTNYDGRVEICYRNQWGTVCDDSWSATDAQVVCRQLGLTMTGALAIPYHNAYYGQGYGGIFLDNVACSGNESQLIDCISSSNIGVHNCQHDDDAGVRCQGTRMLNCTHGDIRLESGRNDREGTLRVCSGGIWSTVCNSGWDSRDAAVVCRQLAYPTSAAIPLPITRFSGGTGVALVSNFDCTGHELNLLDCRYIQRTSYSCIYTNLVGVQCLDPVNATIPCYNGELRLAGGRADSEGRVEVCYQNQWGTVCNNGWGRNDARVVCRQLGFNPLGSVFYASYGGGTGGIFLRDVSCTGSEQFLFNCTNGRNTPYHNCTHSQDAGVICTSVGSCPQGNIRLVRGSTNREGTVEICVNGFWGGICSYQWDSREAQVVCRQLGYNTVLGPIPVLNSRLRFDITSNRPSLLDYPLCHGNETNLLNCTHNGIGVVSSNCGSSRVAGVICPEYEHSDCTNGDIRLIGGTENEGRVEICYLNQWGTICSSYIWSIYEAQVVCHQLGYPRSGGIPLTNAFFGQGSGGIFLSNVRCNGNEDALINCSHDGIGVHTCTHSQDAGVRCLAYPDNCTHGSIRLHPGQSARRGTVEVCVDGYWGTICSSGWDSRDADVVCRQLGFNTFGAVPRTNSHLGRGTGPVFLNLISCYGIESTILDCSFSRSYSYCSGHLYDSGVECVEPSTAPCMNGDIRLIGGSSDSEGRIEICSHGYWGSVCHHHWDDSDARVACRQLGFQPLGGTASRSYYGRASGAFFLDGLRCWGNETALINCDHDGIAVHSCATHEVARVACQDQVPSNCSNGDIQLSQGSQGIIEICIDGYWGTICDNQWNNIDASVACQQLGHSYHDATALHPLRFEETVTLLDGVACVGDEKTLLNCAHNGYGVVSQDCYNYDLAGVHCKVYCPEELSCGLIWPRTVSDSQVSLPCSNAGSHFERHTNVTRHCDINGNWSTLDLSTCTLVEKSITFLLVWFMLEDDNIPINETDLEREMQSILSNRSVNFTTISFQLMDSLNGTAVTVEITLPLENQTEVVTELLQYYSSSSFSMLGSYAISVENRGVQAISASSMCACAQPPSMTSLIELCSGSKSRFSPCNCTTSADCQCLSPFVGDGNRCTLDTDGDGYPDFPLDSPTCRSPQGMSINYCKQDTCPLVTNPNQRLEDCQPLSPVDFDGCHYEIDNTWGIVWPNTQRDSSSEQRCPGGADVLGNATRFCDSTGKWGQANVLNCTSPEFTELEDLAEQVLSALDPEEQVEQVTELAQRLVQVTEPLRNKSLLPNDLGTSARVVADVITVLENNNSTNENVIEIFNNILDDRNRQGWQTLQSAGLSSSSELLLSSAERYALVAVSSVNTSGGEEEMKSVRQSRLNIVVVGEQYREAPTADLQFPTTADLVNFTDSKKSSAITIPSSVVKGRLGEIGDGDKGTVPVFFVLLRNLPMGTFAVNTSTRAISPCTGRNFTTQGASDVIAAQVGAGNRNRTFQDSLQGSPINLNFTFESAGSTVLDSFSCVFWNFSVPIGNGSWITDGVTTNDFTTQKTKSGKVTTVKCSSTHLTSFAVLVDVAGGLEVIGKVERAALQAVSYVGCGISIMCLSVTVIFFLWQGYYQRRLPDSKRVKSVQNFVHTNLSLSLLLAYIVFVMGIETSTKTVGGCAFVAAILHYLFLSAFSWMLCEGILLYLLLRVVFSEMSKKWWPFLLIGYLTPVPIVVITVGARYKYYGVRDSCGNLLYCWLSVEKGTIFGFVAPMLAIILVNVFFMVLALHTLLKAKRHPIERKNDSSLKASTELGRALFVAILVLLPLLGLTWIFGILTVNANSTVFAWLFTFFNSLQGLFIFTFHVIRSDQVWSKISPKLRSLKNKVTSSSGFRGLSTGITGTLTKGKSTGISALPQDPNSTLGRGGVYKKRGRSTSVDELISSTPRNYELKTDLNLVSNLTGTESETKIDLGSVKPPVNASHVESVKVTDMPLSMQKMPCEKQDKVKSEMDPNDNGSGMMSDDSLKVAE